MWTHVWISVLALAASIAVALPFGVWFGHRGSGELLAVRSATPAARSPSSP